MWVFEETLPNGDKLTDVIKQTNVRTVIHLIPIAYAIFLFFFNEYSLIIFVLHGRKMLSTSQESS